MQTQPLPAPCSMFEAQLESIHERVDGLRKELLWPEHNQPIASADEPITMTFAQYERLFGLIRSILTELQMHERERVRKIMERI